MTEPLGRRERKKEQTRRRIEETARRLFRERGFERVTVAQIAREADVAEHTVYNYFPTKEDLVYWRLESFEEALLQAIRERAPGEPIPAAFGRWLLAQRGMLAEWQGQRLAAAPKTERAAAAPSGAYPSRHRLRPPRLERREAVAAAGEGRGGHGHRRHAQIRPHLDPLPAPQGDRRDQGHRRQS